MKRNLILEGRIGEFVSLHPGQKRREIARGLQKSGVILGQQHISNRIGEMIALGQLREQIDERGNRLVYPLFEEGTGHPENGNGGLSNPAHSDISTEVDC